MPEKLPRAGMKVWLETSIANGPLNGAMQQETLDEQQVI